MTKVLSAMPTHSRSVSAANVGYAAAVSDFFDNRSSVVDSFAATLSDLSNDVPYNCWSELEPLVTTKLRTADEAHSTTTDEEALFYSARATQWVAKSGLTVKADPHPNAVGDAFFRTSATSPVAVFELCGGLCSGLEMLLRNGVHVGKYRYNDNSASATIIAKHRVALLRQRYGELFPDSAVEGAFETLPNDVKAVTVDDIMNLGGGDARVLIMSGWPCQGLSQANATGEGLDDSRSDAIIPIVKLIQRVCQRRGSNVAYLLENVNTQHAYGARAGQGAADTEKLFKILGQPITFDAAAVGSRSHRVRNWWANFCDTRQGNVVFANVVREPGIYVNQVLTQGYFAKSVPVSAPPFYPCNGPNKQREALPTLVRFPQSHMFREHMPGMVYKDVSDLTSRVRKIEVAREPNPEERERLLGFDALCTAAAGVSSDDRTAALGNAWSIDAAASLLSVAIALSKLPTSAAVSDATAATFYANVPTWAFPWDEPLPYDAVEPSFPDGVSLMQRVCSDNIRSALVGASKRGHGGVPAAEEKEAEMVSGLGHSRELMNEYVANCAMGAVASLADADGAHADPHKDNLFLRFLKEGDAALGAETAKRAALRKRAATYEMLEGGELRRLFKDQSTRIVPRPEEREALVIKLHEQSGHFGSRRTEALVRQQYWWPGLSVDVRKLASECAACDQVRASRGGTQVPQLRPLPLATVGYRFSCDWAGGFPASELGNQHLFIVVEHCTRWVEVWPSAKKNAAVSAFLFSMLVVARFGAPAECLTDGGPEFSAEFSELMAECMISQRKISPGSPQSNGLAERIVQVFKKAFAKLGAGGLDEAKWDMAIASVLHAYRITVQTSLKFSPYELLYTVKPTVPAAAAGVLLTPLDDFGWIEAHHEEVALQLIQRGAEMARHRAHALSNLQVAQVRDTLRYAKVRSGAYLPTLRRFRVGDLVYLSRERSLATRANVHDTILRVVGFKSESGDAVLEGSDGTRMSTSVSQLRPCHLTNVDLTIDERRMVPGDDLACEVCHWSGNAAELLLCDKCNRGYHLKCLEPKLKKVPAGQWYCPECAGGVALAERKVGEAAWFVPKLATHRRRDRWCREFHGKSIAKKGAKGSQAIVGLVRYDGFAAEPPFYVEWANGTNSRLTEKEIDQLKVVGPSAAAASAATSYDKPSLTTVQAHEMWAKVEQEREGEFALIGRAMAEFRRTLLPQPVYGKSHGYEGLDERVRYLQEENCSRVVKGRVAQEYDPLEAVDVAAETDVAVLADVVNLRRHGNGILIPFITRRISQVLNHKMGDFKNVGRHARLPSAGLDPIFYDHYGRYFLNSAVIVAAAPRWAWDYILGLVVTFAWCNLACLRVDRSYLNGDDRDDRAAALNILRKKGRLAFLTSPKSNFVWMCVCKDERSRDKLISDVENSLGASTRSLSFSVDSD